VLNPFFLLFQHLHVKQERNAMTDLLEKAFEIASKLPALEQNILARTLLDEIESEKKWDDLFTESEDVLAELATEALNEDKQGKTTELDPSKL